MALERLAARCTETTCIVGLPLAEDAVYNGAAVLSGGAVHAIYRKNLLPNYGVFDEQRYFTAGPRGTVLDGPWGRIGLTVCEDIWVPGPPSESEAHAGAWLITNISASPYHAGKGAEREAMLAARAIETGAYIAFCALVGGQDELVFDGHSCVIDPTGPCRPGRAVRAGAAAVRDHRVGRRARRGPAPTSRSRRRSARPRSARCARAKRDGSHRFSSHPRQRSTARCASDCTTTSKRTAFRRLVLGLSGRNRLGARRDARGRRPRRRARERRGDALAVQLQCDAGRRPRAGRGARRGAARAAHRARDGRLHRDARGRVRRPRRRHHRGEPPGPDPREPADGALEQVRLARAHDRQQVRDVGWLLDSLRRPRRRLRGDQGRPEDACLPAQRVA